MCEEAKKQHERDVMLPTEEERQRYTEMTLAGEAAELAAANERAEKLIDGMEYIRDIDSHQPGMSPMSRLVMIQQIARTRLFAAREALRFTPAQEHCDLVCEVCHGEGDVCACDCHKRPARRAQKPRPLPLGHSFKSGFYTYCNERVNPNTLYSRLCGQPESAHQPHERLMRESGLLGLWSSQSHTGDAMTPEQPAPKRRTLEEQARELEIAMHRDGRDIDLRPNPEKMYAVALAALREAADSGKTEGATWMLNSIRAALSEYPTTGCDIEVAKHVERIAKAAADARDAGWRGKLERIRNLVAMLKPPIEDGSLHYTITCEINEALDSRKDQA